MATRNLVINDPVGIHARPAAMFAQAVTASVVLFLIGSSRLEPVHQTRPLTEKHTGVQGTL